MDGTIDAALCREMDSLDQVVLGKLANNDLKGLMPLLSDSLKKASAKRLPELLRDMQTTVQDKTFKVRHRFFINGTRGKSYALSSGNGGDHDYTLNIRSYSRRNFVSLSYCEDSLLSHSMITAWGNYKGEWKLNILRLGPYKILGEDAMYWYQKAEHDYRWNDPVDATNHILLAMEVLEPAEGHFSYQKKAQVKQLIKDIDAYLAQYVVLPYIIRDVATSPELYKIGPYIADRKCYPIFHYKSNLGMQDTLALSRECDSVHKALNLLFKGVNEKNKYNLYRAMDRIPLNEQDSFRYYQMVRENTRYRYFNT